MSTLALWVGYIVIVCGGLALAALICSLAMDYVWRTIKLTYDMETLGKAMRQYDSTKEPTP